MPKYEYCTAECTASPNAQLERHAEQGWRLVGVLHGRLTPYGHAPSGCTLFFERPAKVEAPDELKKPQNIVKQIERELART